MGFVRYPVDVYMAMQRSKRERARVHEQREHELKVASLYNNANKQNKQVNITIHNHYESKPKKPKHKKCVDVIQFIK